MFNRTYSLVAFAALALTACATEMSDDGQEPLDHETGSQAEGLTKVDPVGGGPIDVGGGTGGKGGSGGGTTTTPKKAPKVISRTASGSQITVKFDRAVSTDEIMLAKTTVSVVRHAAGNFQTMNLATGATLSADKMSMTIQLSQPMKAGEVYYARSKWKSTPTSKELRAELGEIAVSNGHFGPLNDAVVGNLQLQMIGTSAPAPTGKQVAGASPLLATATAAAAAPAAAPLVHMVQLAEDPLPTAGTFKIKSMTPADLSEGNKRETDRVIVTFEGGTIDCTKTARGKDGFHLYSVTPDVGFQQDMYEDPAAPSPTNAGAFRGAIRCEEDENRIIFTTPGRLYGDAWFHLDLNAYSKEGNFIHKEREFKTERPGIVVSATRVENHYGTHDTCDSDGFFGSDNYCDIYVTSAIAARGAGQNGRIPEQGDFSEMRYFPSDANGGSRYLSPPRILFATAQPIDSVVDVQMWAIDADTDSEWKKIFEVAGEIAQATAATLAPFDPKDAAIAEGVSAGFQGLAKIIPTNEDDLLGSGRFLFTRDDARWGTQRGYETELQLSKNAPGRGPVKVFIYTEEFPRPWTLTFVQ